MENLRLLLGPYITPKSDTESIHTGEGKARNNNPNYIYHTGNNQYDRYNLGCYFLLWLGRHVVLCTWYRWYFNCQWSDQSLTADKHDCKQSGVTSESKAESSASSFTVMPWYYAVYYIINVQNKSHGSKHTALMHSTNNSANRQTCIGNFNKLFTTN